MSQAGITAFSWAPSDGRPNLHGFLRANDCAINVTPFNAERGRWLAMENPSGFKGKVGLVVGGASGMGNAAVRLLNQAGVRTHVLDIKNTADGVFQLCDVRDYDQVRRCVQQVVTQEGRIDLLFIAAGVHLFANIEQTSIEEF